jgi:magnesium-transporting ATPase (P-type)
MGETYNNQALPEVGRSASDFSIPPPAYVDENPQYTLPNKKHVSSDLAQGYRIPELSNPETSEPYRDTKKWAIIMFFLSLIIGIFTFGAGGLIFLLYFRGHYAVSGIHFGTGLSFTILASIIFFYAFTPPVDPISVLLGFLYTGFASASCYSGSISYKKAQL